MQNDGRVHVCTYAQCQCIHFLHTDVALGYMLYFCPRVMRGGQMGCCVLAGLQSEKKGPRKGAQRGRKAGYINC